MLLFPYASGYGLGSDPLWRLLLTLWNASDEWKHGMFVFPIAAVLIFLKRTELAKVPIKGSNWGLLLIVPSLFLYWVGFVANVQYIGYLAIQLMLGGCVIWFLGVRFFKAVFFIWCFLFFAYPFIFLEDLVAFPLRLLMSEASVRFLNLIGFHSIRDGTAIISAADPVAGIVNGQRYSVDVADPCSGIRSLFALTMISDVNKKTEPGVIMKLPNSIGDYLGFDTDITESEHVILPRDTEFAKKRYSGFDLPEITTEIVLSGAQRQSIHRPQVCLAGQGWAIQKEETIPITLADGREQKVRKLTLLRTQDGIQVVGYFIYWFVGKDKTTDDHFERIFLTSWDRIVHRVNHRWAYVIVNAILPPEPTVTAGERQKVLSDLLSFTGELIPQIQRPEVNAIR